jgi:SAM-dependent methyltransferase
MHESRYKNLIQETYNRLAAEYGGTTAGDEPLPPEYEHLFTLVEEAFPQGGRALDLGCGDARRFTQRLARSFSVVGVDFSESQLAEAGKTLPEATFFCQDIAEFDAEPESFEVIVCLYALFHLALKEQRFLIHRVAQWLVPGGYAVLLFNNRQSGGQDVEENWCGGPMRWFHYSRLDYEQMLEDVGLRQILSFTEDDAEPEAWRVGLYKKEP